MHGEYVCDTSIGREDDRERKETVCSLPGSIEKAYDRVWRTGLWEALKQYGVEGRLLRAVQGMYKNSEAAVKVGEEITEWFKVQRGVRQGCPMSPWLFNIYLDMVTREALPLFKRGAGLTNCQIQVTLFADDTVLLAE